MNLDILHARYAPDAEQLINAYLRSEQENSKKRSTLLTALKKQLDDPKLERMCPQFPNYVIPQQILDANTKVRSYIQSMLSELQKNNQNDTLTDEELRNFFVQQHENIKWAQNRWLIANPGLGFEPMVISNSLHPIFLQWLEQNFQLRVGDPVLHFHVISNRGRQRLQNIGVSVPFEHWNEAYFQGMVLLGIEIINSWPICKGLFCDSSWVLNPGNFQIAPDGKPFASFTYLKNQIYYGHIFDVTHLISKKDLETQINFSLRSERRKKYADIGKFHVKVFGSFYPIQEMIQHSHWLKQ